MLPTNRIHAWGIVLAAWLIPAVVFQLLRQGRRWWCACGEAGIWSSDVRGAHNSQHLFDYYSATHLLHGMILWGLLAWIAANLTWHWQFFLAVFAESVWELLENSKFIIDRYRNATAALGYEGDSIANSLGDILSCAGGFLIARKLGVRRSCVIVVLVEFTLLFAIRDNLILNIIMLIYPIESIRSWQR